MTTLTDFEIERLFSGAPQYFARSEGHNTGAPHPSVAFPWDEELPIRDLTDHTQIENHAWRCATAWPHITRGARRNSNASLDKARAHFYPRCRERPSMLSMLGLEKGTIGYQAALELSVSDSLQEEQFGFGSLGCKSHIVLEHRQKLVSSKDGLRFLREDFVLDQLIKNGKRYKDGLLSRDMSSELYNDLFLHILHPPNRIIDHGDPYSLVVQIQALIKVLAAPNVWCDFSRLEWRIRLGQVLWGTVDGGDEIADGSSITDADSISECIQERFWLLLQVLLACELLIRLDAITAGEELGVESIHPEDVRRFERDANVTVKWSLILARVWLENIEVLKKDTDLAVPKDHHHNPIGWLAALTERMTLRSHRRTKSHQDGKMAAYTVKGMHGERQIDGLTQFARKLRWPDIDAYEARIMDLARTVNNSTPVSGTPRTSLGDLPRPQTSASARKHNAKSLRLRRRKVQATLNRQGWLSKSYISGLVLPGDCVSHFLMATLLENDKGAMQALGPVANLAGGFVYHGKSFWSTSCIVGRVLAAGRGSAECMGWISSDVIPSGFSDGWFNVAVDEIPGEAEKTGKKARLWDKHNVERDSDVLGNADPAFVFPADFIIPVEDNYITPPPFASFHLQSLDLNIPTDPLETTPSPTEENGDGFPFDGANGASKIETYPSSMTFSASMDGDSAAVEHTIALSKEVYFVTAHPCVPSPYVKFVKSPSSPTIQHIDVSGSGPTPGRISTTANVTGHPLHKFFTYTVIHLSDLFQRRSETLDALLNNTPAARLPSLTPAQNKPPSVLIIDCITNFPRNAPTDPTPTSPLTADAHGGGVINSLDPILTPASSSSGSSTTSFGADLARSHPGRAARTMYMETRRRQFGSDLEILARAICAEKGWNALVSRRRRGCLACAIREAGALDWKVIIRVD